MLWSIAIWGQRLYSISLQHSIFMVTGKDMGVFIDKWIRAGGHAQFHMDFFFNRKRNTVEMNITQVRNSPLIV